MVASVAKTLLVDVPAPSVFAPEQVKPGLSRRDQNRIGQQLQAMYDMLCDEPVPQHLQDLIRRLGQTE